MRIHVLKRKSSALEGERGRPVVNTVVLPEFRVASLGEHAACLDVVDVPIRKPSLADCGGRKQRTAKHLTALDQITPSSHITWHYMALYHIVRLDEMS